MRTLIDVLRQHAETTPERVLYTFLRDDNQRETLTFAELDDRARTLAGAFLQDAAPGDRALMTYPPGLEFIEAFLGCLYAGIVAVPAYPPKKNRNAERVLAIAHDCEPRLILCTAETRSNVLGEFAEAIKGAEVLLTDEISTGSGTGLPGITPDGLAFLQYTSVRRQNRRG